MRTAVAIFAVTVMGLAGCSTDESSSAEGPTLSAGDSSRSSSPSPTTISSTTSTSSTSTMPEPTTTSTTSTTSTTTTSTSTTSTTTTTTTATTTTTTLAPLVIGSLDLTADRITLGASLQGRPIVAERLGALGGRRVLVIGVIHGNEDDGVAIIEQLRSLATPDDVELWLVESMNPDGQAAQIRQNGNQVDLNRNFPYKWGEIGQPGDSQFAGTGPASELETQAIVNFISQLRPDITIWYHQDANLVIPSTGRDGRIRARYAELTDLPIATCCSGGTGIYTGIAATWASNELKQTSDAVPFIVELPGSLSADQAEQHANAVLTIATEG